MALAIAMERGSDANGRRKFQSPRRIFASSAAATKALRAAGGWLSPRNTRRHASIAALRFSVSRVRSRSKIVAASLTSNTTRSAAWRLTWTTTGRSNLLNSPFPSGRAARSARPSFVPQPRREANPIGQHDARRPADRHKRCHARFRNSAMMDILPPLVRDRSKPKRNAPKPGYNPNRPYARRFLQAAIHCMAEIGSSRMATCLAKSIKPWCAALNGLCPSSAS